jgi:hypothetical protein
MEQTNKPWHFSKGDKLAVYLRMKTKCILIVAALLCAAQLGGYYPLNFIKKYKVLNFIILLSLVASIIYNIFDRNFYLPFLGWTAYPCGGLAEKIPRDADTTVTVQVKPNVNVIYWGSEPKTNEEQPIDNPWDAYANYDNSGVVRADAQGKAVLHFRNPSIYQVGLMNRTLKKHIHYRECRHPGMLSSVKTVNL